MEPTDDTLTPKQIEQIEQRIAKTRSHLEAALAELDRLTSALGPTVTSQVKRLFATWSRLWWGRYAERYVFAGAKDGSRFKRLLQVLPVDDLERRLERYISNQQPFVVQNRHPLNLFFGNVNAYGDQGDSLWAVVGCNHEPRCQSDAEHTRKALREAKGA